MSWELVLLAVLMGAVTYPSRASPCCRPASSGCRRRCSSTSGSSRRRSSPPWPRWARWSSAGRTARPAFHVGIEWLAVGLAIAIVWWRRNLFLGLLVAVVIAAAGRAVGLA